jgi:hypothetical protein
VRPAGPERFNDFLSRISEGARLQRKRGEAPIEKGFRDDFCGMICDADAKRQNHPYGVTAEGLRR